LLFYTAERHTIQGGAEKLENAAPYNCKGGKRETGNRGNDKVWEAKRNLSYDVDDD